MKSLKVCLFSMVFVLLVAGMSYGSDSAHDQLNRMSDGWHTTEDLKSDEARLKASQGFDDGMPPNLRGGEMQHVPAPKPKIERTESNE